MSEPVELAYVKVSRILGDDENAIDQIIVETDENSSLLDQLGLIEFGKAHLLAPMITDTLPEDDDQ